MSDFGKEPGLSSGRNGALRGPQSEGGVGKNERSGRRAFPLRFLADGDALCAITAPHSMRKPASMAGFYPNYLSPYVSARRENSLFTRATAADNRAVL